MSIKFLSSDISSKEPVELASPTNKMTNKKNIKHYYINL